MTEQTQRAHPLEPPPDPRLEQGRVCNRGSHELPRGFLSACGIKNRCPNCGYLYPVGDCAD